MPPPSRPARTSEPDGPAADDGRRHVHCPAARAFTTRGAGVADTRENLAGPPRRKALWRQARAAAAQRTFLAYRVEVAACPRCWSDSFMAPSSELTGRPHPGRDPSLFSDIPLFLTTSALTGWSCGPSPFSGVSAGCWCSTAASCTGTRRRTRPAPSSGRIIDPASLRTVEAPAGVAADGLLETLDKERQDLPGRAVVGMPWSSTAYPRPWRPARETVPRPGQRSRASSPLAPPGFRTGWFPRSSGPWWNPASTGLDLPELAGASSRSDQLCHPPRLGLIPGTSLIRTTG